MEQRKILISSIAKNDTWKEFKSQEIEKIDKLLAQFLENRVLPVMY
jgi:hypothetical protein